MPAEPTGLTTDDQGATVEHRATGSGDEVGEPRSERPGATAPGRPDGIPDAPVLRAPGQDATSPMGRAPGSPGGPGGAPGPPSPGEGPGVGAAVLARGSDVLGSVRQRVGNRRSDNKRATSRHARRPRRGVQVDQRLWSISPWSVFKVSALFYLCLALIVLVAGTLLYNAGRSVGTVEQFEGFVSRMGAYGECVPTADVAEGTAFVEDETCEEGEVLVGGFTLDDGVLFRVAAIGGTILVVAGTIGNVLLVVLWNLLNELTGGVRHTVIREQAPRQQGSPGSGPGAPRRRQAGTGPPNQPPMPDPASGPAPVGRRPAPSADDAGRRTPDSPTGRPLGGPPGPVSSGSPVEPAQR